jgi:Big-like domain-containing protein
MCAALLATLALQSCGGGGDLCNGPFCVSPPEKAEPSQIEAGEHNGQQGAPGRELKDSVDVIVKDADGGPVSGIKVNFSVKTGGGALSSETATSDVNGVAQVSWTLGQEIGAQTIEARATNSGGTELGNSPLELSAQAVPPQPTQLVIQTGPSETAQNGVPLEQQPVIEVYDADNQPVPQVEIVASVAEGGATTSGTTSATSDASGRATFAGLALIGPQGPQTLRFSVATPAIEIISTTPVQLSAGTAAALEAVGPTSFEGIVNSPVTPGPSVIAKDGSGNPVAGVPVTFTANRNASVSPETATTDEQGLAQVSWTLGSSASGSYTLTARVESAAVPPIQFSAVARPGGAGRLRITVQPSSGTASGTPFATQPVVQLEDQNGNPTPQAGVTVTATISAGPKGSVANATASTNGSGQAAFSGLTLTGLAGSYTLSFSASNLVGVNSSPFTITVGAPAKLAITKVPSTRARSRAPLVIQPVLQVQDASGNPVRQGGVVVTASVTAPNTTLGGAAATTDESGKATFTALVITGIPGPKDLTFSAPNLQSATARVLLPSVAAVTASATHPTSAIVGSTIGGPVITWTFLDASTGGRPVADADFTVQLPSGGTVVAPQFSDEFGTVQVSNWTLGTTAGKQYLELRLPDGRVFRDSILATPAAASDLRLDSGDEQTAAVNSELPNPLIVRVVDQYGNGVPSVPVQWATCDGTAGPLLNTDDNGYSSVNQPTGAEPTEGCTMASIAQPAAAVQFHYHVTASGTEGQQPQGVSAMQSRRGGPPPVAPQDAKARPSP